MTEPERYFSTFGRHAGEPMGVLDAWGGSEFTGVGVVARGGLSASQLGALVLLAFVFAAGVYGGMLLFGRHDEATTTVVVCPGPGSAPVAVLPAECGPSQGVAR
ncbi:hypothetical protein [Nocardia terpenica]|uniref:Uncharacterized protein n=1 Tax=Nocardia terpenica TaxID=455432 RepID=A0A6G9Z256_9NOCA|nr:hypothetical protein [Nocardia terpenica]QIS19562.1 hypothetical protein F6W96_15990 [Nocardia terpenica]